MDQLYESGVKPRHFKKAADAIDDNMTRRAGEKDAKADHGEKSVAHAEVVKAS